MLTDLPNLLTLSRIVAIPLLVVLVALRQPSADLAACVLFSTAAITDYFDGKARPLASPAVRSRPHARPDRRQAAGRRGADDAGRPGTPVHLGPVSRHRHHAARDPGERTARVPRRDPHRAAGHAARQMEDRLPDGRARHPARRRLDRAPGCTCRSCRSPRSARRCCGLPPR